MPAIKSAISVGLLYVPVSLQKTTRDTSIHFNQLCKNTHQRIKYQKYCPSCNKEVKSEDIVKGYEFEKGQYVTISEDELEKIKTKADRTIHIIAIRLVTAFAIRIFAILHSLTSFLISTLFQSH